MRWLLCAALLWTGFNVCLMPQSQCEAKSKPACHCQHGKSAKCCAGVHLEEAGIGGTASAAASTLRQYPIAQPAPEPDAAVSGEMLLPIAAAAVPLRPPPRESAGRSPPLA